MVTASQGTSAKSSVILLVRLGIMMFLQFFIWGSWYVSMNGFLTDSGMSGFIAAAYTVAPIAAIVAPLSLGLVTDRLLNTEWVLAILNLLGAVLLWFTPALASAGEPTGAFSQFTHPMILCLLAYLICFMPTLGLTASLSFKHLSNGEKEFPIVRVLGTIGWIFGNWVMWGCRMFTDDAETFGDNSAHMFHAAAIASALLGVYCLTLPRTAPPAKGEKISLGKILGVEAWAMLKDKSFFVFAVASFLICIPLAGYYAMGYGYVDQSGVKLFGSTTGAMSTGQMSEILFMLLMPVCFARFGVKNMLIIGMLAWAVRYGLWGLSFGQEGPLLTIPIFLGILLHGICYDFFFVSGMIYTDKKANPEIRGQAQSLIVMLTQGLGLGIGAQAFGWWTTQCTSGDAIDFSKFWYIPAAFALVVMLFFAVSFWDRSTDEGVSSRE